MDADVDVDAGVDADVAADAGVDKEVEATEANLERQLFALSWQE